MSYTLTIKAFFFNAQTDYLPYYKHFTVILDESAKAVDILAKIKAENENFSYPETKLVFKINGLVVEGEQPVDDIVARLGTDLQIDPVNAYRSNNGLIINDDDFMERYAMLSPYTSEDDLAFYQTLYALHYASETEKFDHDYIGDAILVLAHKLITQGSEHSEEILHTISETFSGLFASEYENNLFHAQDHTAAIEELKQMAKPSAQAHSSTFIDKMAAKFMKKSSAAKKAVDGKKITGKKIAYYFGGSNDHSETVIQKITSLGAGNIPFDRAGKLSGLSLLETAQELAFKKAGTTLLDALDRGAEILVIENEAYLAMFTEHLGAIENTMGRDIPLKLLSAQTFLASDETVAA